MDWGHSALGQVLGSEYQVIYFFSALTWSIFLTVHLFSIKEQPLAKDPSAPDTSPPSALRVLGSHSNGYGTLSKEPVSAVAPASAPDLRPRSFSALGEANSVTSSAKQPNKEVCAVGPETQITTTNWKSVTADHRTPQQMRNDRSLLIVRVVFLFVICRHVFPFAIQSVSPCDVQGEHLLCMQIFYHV